MQRKRLGLWKWKSISHLLCSIWIHLDLMKGEKLRKWSWKQYASVERVKEIHQSRHSSIQLSVQHFETKTNGLRWFTVSVFYIASFKVLSQLLLHRETLSGKTNKQAKKSQQVWTCCQFLCALDVKLWDGERDGAKWEEHVSTGTPLTQLR